MKQRKPQTTQEKIKIYESRIQKLVAARKKLLRENQKVKLNENTDLSGAIALKLKETKSLVSQMYKAKVGNGTIHEYEDQLGQIIVYLRKCENILAGTESP